MSPPLAALLGWLAAAAVAAAPPPAVSPPRDLDVRTGAVLARALNAAGGVDRLRGLGTLRVRARVESAGLVGQVQIALDSEGSYVERSRLGPLEEALAFGPDAPGWFLEHGAVHSPVPPARRRAGLDSAYYDTWRYLLPGAPGLWASLRGPSQDRETEPCQWVELRPSGVTPRRICFSDATGLPTQARFQSPDSGAEVRVRYRAWRHVDGVALPFLLRVEKKGLPGNALTLAVTAWELGPRIQPEDLAAPEDPGPPALLAAEAARGIPLHFDGSHLYLGALVDGRGPFTFLLDTGSSTSVLDRALARALGLVPEGEIDVRTASGPVRHQLVRVPSFELPGVRLTSVTWTAAPLRTTLRSRLGRDVHGLVGADLLRRFVTVVDYSRGRLSLHDPEEWEAPMGAVALPVEVVGGVPTVRISVDGEATEPFVVDTGSEIGAVFGGSDLARRLLERHGPGSPAVADGVSGPVPVTALRATSLDAWPFRIALPVLHVVDAPHTVPGAAALLGTPFLSRFTCAFDLSRGILWLVPDGRYGDPEPLDRSGLALGWEEGGWRVQAIARGSPAEAAGLPVGALVRAIQGTPLGSLPRGAWRRLLAGAAGREIALEIGPPGGRGRRVRLNLAPPLLERPSSP